MEDTFSIREYLALVRKSLGRIHVMADESGQMDLCLKSLDKAIGALEEAEKGVKHHDDQAEQREDA